MSDVEDAIKAAMDHYANACDGASTASYPHEQDDCGSCANHEQAIRHAVAVGQVEAVRGLSCRMAQMFRDDFRECAARIAAGEEIAHLPRIDADPNDREAFTAALMAMGKPADVLIRRPWAESDKCDRCRELTRLEAEAEAQ